MLPLFHTLNNYFICFVFYVEIIFSMFIFLSSFFSLVYGFYNFSYFNLFTLLFNYFPFYHSCLTL